MGRIPVDRGIRRNVSGYNRASTNHGVLSDVNREDRGVSSDRSAVPYHCLTQRPVACGLWIAVIRETHMRTNEHIVSDSHTFRDESKGLYLAAVAYDDVISYPDRRVDHAVIPDPTIENDALFRVPNHAWPSNRPET